MIVKNSGISKGALFEYFGNKSDLFMYVVDKSISTLDENIKRYIDEKIDYYYEIVGKIFMEGIDYSKFKEGTDPDKVYEILTYISEGLQNKYMKKYHGDFHEMLDNLDDMCDEVFSYINFIRDCVYK